MRVYGLTRPAESLTYGCGVGFSEVADNLKNPGIRFVPNHPPMVADEQVSPTLASIEFKPHRCVLYAATLSLKDVLPVLLVQPEGYVGGGREGRATPDFITDVFGKSLAVMNHQDDGDPASLGQSPQRVGYGRHRASGILLEPPACSGCQRVDDDHPRARRTTSASRRSVDSSSASSPFSRKVASAS